MSQPKFTEFKEPIHTIEHVCTEETQHASETPCSTHGPSQAPLLEREFQKPRSQEVIKSLSQALSDLASEDRCIRCTAENISTLLTGHVRQMREAKRNGEWSREDRKAMKAEFKAVFRPMKKDIKGLWKAN